MTGKLLASKKETGLQIEEIEVPGYEKILKVTEAKSKLKALIAIHNTVLGPALGGIRIFPYASLDLALEDVLRLARGMTYKSAVAEVGFGGGKSVIMADPQKDKTEALLCAFGRAVECLKGKYICAEDVGCSVKDVGVIRKETKYVVGLAHEKSSGNPAPFTAWGTFRGIQSALKKVFGSDSLEGKTVALQGVGSVGEVLAELLFWHGARVTIADINQAKVAELQHKFGFKAVAVEQIFQEECDVFAPCAMGGIINDKTLPHLKCRIVAGCANNQLLKPENGEALKARRILYVPDFVINAGGLINVAHETEKRGYHPQSARNKTNQIYDVLTSIYEIAEKKQISTSRAALELGDYRLKYGVGKRSVEPYFHH
ncbi:MAG: Glu/Leu/Phe/Val dehydrogenase dimerization domain-containing protein [Parachlamydiales bacterium]|jgi:leucine dehydrogenase